MFKEERRLNRVGLTNSNANAFHSTCLMGCGVIGAMLLLAVGDTASADAPKAPGQRDPFESPTEPRPLAVKSQPSPVPRKSAGPTAALQLRQPNSVLPRTHHDSAVRPATASLPAPQRLQTKRANSKPIEASRTNSADIPPRVRQLAELATQAKDEATYSQIIDLSEEILQNNPDATVTSYLHRLSGWAFNRRGQLFVKLGDEAAALEDFNAAISHDANCWRAWHNRGVSRAISGRHGEALRDFEQTIRLQPKYTAAHRNRGEAFYELGQWDSAVAAYSSAIELKSNDAELYYLRGDTFHRLGKLDLAKSDLDHALDLYPDHGPSYLSRGNLLADVGHYEAAIADLKRARSLQPQNAEAHRSLAWLWATCPDNRFQNSAAAIAAAKTATKLLPDADWLYLDTLAAAYASANDFARAKSTQTQAVRLASGTAKEKELRVRLAQYQEQEPFLTPDVIVGD